MSISDELLARLPGAGPRHVLDELVRVGRALAAAGRPRPEIECHLASGAVIRGRVISVADERGQAIALVLSGGNARAPSVTYVRVDQIAALTVVDASLLVEAPAIDAPVPGRLELARQLAARAEALARELGRPLALELAAGAPLDDDGRRAVGVLLPLLAEALTAIARDPMGREALGALDAIELAAAPSSELRRDGRRLVIHAPQRVTDQLTASALREAIEKLL